MPIPSAQRPTASGARTRSLPVRFAAACLALCVALVAGTAARPGDTPSTSPWPPGIRAAVSLSFDDARVSQLTTGVPLLKELGVAATFYLTASSIGAHGAEWKAAARRGPRVGAITR